MTDIQQIFEYIRKHHMISKDDRVILGVSGGADSVCLLLVLLELQRKIPFWMKVIHVEHGIRGQASIADAEFVEKLCEKLGVEEETFHLDLPAIAAEQKLTVEEAGRKMRYQIFEEQLGKCSGTRIAVAHNQNDQAETMLFHMVRGSGLKGSAGIRPVRGNVIRPLLSTDRKRIEEIVRSHGIKWREDETNQDTVYTRNLIRGKVLPLLEQGLNQKSVAHLFALSEELQETEQYLEKETACAFETCVTLQVQDTKTDTAKIQIPLLQKEDDLIRKRVLRLCLERIDRGLKDITREHIQMLLQLMQKESGKSVNLPGGWTARREFDCMILGRSENTEDKGKKEELLPERGIPLSINGTTTIGKHRFSTRILSDSDAHILRNQQIPQKRYTKWLNYDRMNNTLVFRTRRAGDYLVVNREGGKKKLKAYLMEERIPVSERDRVPLICSGQEVAWVVGHRISEQFKVESDTKRILEIVYEEVM